MTKKTETPKEIKVEEVLTEAEIQETNMSVAERDFIASMKANNLPPQAKYLDMFIFHRETGREMTKFEDIFKSGRNAFEVWSKTKESALEIFMDKSRWEERMGDTPCPIPLEEKEK